MTIARTARPSRAAYLSCFLALLLSPAHDALAQVGSVTVKKGHAYIQSSATAVALDPATNNYGWGADVDGTNIGGIAPPMVTGPINTQALGAGHNNGRLVYSAGDRGWRWGSPHASDFGSATLAQLNSFFGSGTYTFTVNGATVPLQLTGDAYPNVPVLTLTGGAWKDGKYVVDPAQPVTITTNPFTAYGQHPDSLICILRVGGAFALPFASVGPFGCAWAAARQFRSQVPNSNVLSHTIPANTLTSGQEYVIGADFISMVDVQPNAALPGSVNAAYYEVFTSLTLKAESAVFPMVVTGSIGPAVANITATIQYRPQDVGSTGSVYAFAVAPQTIVQPGPLKAASDALPPLGYARARADGKATGVACVLAQLNASGRLVGVSASSLQAYVSGVLGAAGQAIAVLDGVATANIGGTTFYVGYGPNAQAMLSGGVNRNVVAVPGSIECKPQPPQTGWWFNPEEGGRGYSIEARGNRLFFAAFHYDANGKATWNFAGGATSIDGSLFTGDFLAASGGQALTGTYRLPGLANAGAITLAFSDESHGTMSWPGGSVAIERQPIVPEGLDVPRQTGLPEGGWWWNPDESGRGFFIEWQNGWVDIAGYMYDDAGNPTWYIAAYPTPNPMLITGNWWTFGGGQSMGGAYRPATRTSDNVGALRVEFTGPATATMQLPDGRRIPIVRQAF